jgi:hypothetical protein
VLHFFHAVAVLRQLKFDRCHTERLPSNRVSTKKQEQRNELNLPAQQQKSEDWAKRAGIPVLKVFVGQVEEPSLAYKMDCRKIPCDFRPSISE